ncbi:hypothetical protein GCM10018793_25520 [Streptomyces sulfonofaciens]|uniref:DUF5666 domain-containing protein n=1 Tax=Streptomyces sulfonofaciens TaxID=68272 RepID=A0A919KZJ4_9ACTN|nr:hypothetical protein [Streptomyces sulfonofaciens]GHH77441.1 hypothetical protein GCM10018793_25520 [Streptomyces sulfonofaciens]
MDKRTLALAGATVLCAGGVAFAATASASTGGAGPAPAPSSSDGSPKAPAAPDVPRVLHSESVAQDPDTGRLTTRDVQSGKVVSASGSTLTVRSADGTQWTWTLAKDTRIATEKSGRAAAKDVGTGDSVTVTGTRDGDTRTARTVSDPPRALAGDVRKKLRKRLGRELGSKDLDAKDLKELRKEFRKHFGDLPHVRDLPGGQDGARSSV